MPEISPGERALLWLRWFVYDAGARPVAVAAVLTAVGVIAAMAASVVGASAEPVGGLRPWIYFAVGGFRTDVQLGLLVATCLLAIDALTGDPFRGQRAVFGLLVAAAAAGVLANVVAIVTSLSDIGVPPVGLGTTAEGWTEVIAEYLSPTAVACVSGWLALHGVRSSRYTARDHL